MMTLDPQVKAALEMMAQQSSAEMHTMTPDEARQAYRSSRNSDDVEEVGSVKNDEIPGPAGMIPIRIYKPSNVTEDKLPILVFYHGGGWVIGDLDTHDAVCRILTNEAGCMVVSVDYRMGPEHKFPAASDDAFAALEWIANNAESIGGDKGKIAVGGDSAGGNLATVAAIKAKEKQAPALTYQLLIYPSTGVGKTKSFEDNGEGYFLTKDLMEWFRKHYMNDPSDANNPYFSPYLYKDVSGLPPALIMTAEYDPLKDDGKAYADKLENAGVDVEYIDYPGMIHGFVTLENVIDKGREALAYGGKALRKAFS